MFYNILDKKRLNILSLLKDLKKDFYLGGGTALALQIGHRDSVDFDFFSSEEINMKKFFERLKNVFFGHKLIKTQEDINTLTVMIDENIKVSFFVYKYKLVRKMIDEENFRLASIEDIGSMKLSAVTGRAANKDYIDLYYIIQKIGLKELLDAAKEKFSELDQNLILKSVVYFEDVEIEPINFKNNNYVNFEDVKEFLKNEVKKLSQSNSA